MCTKNTSLLCSALKNLAARTESTLIMHYLTY